MLVSHRLVAFLVLVLIIVFYAFSLVVFPDEPILRHSTWSEWSKSSQSTLNSTLGVRFQVISRDLAHAYLRHNRQFQKIFVINLPTRTDRRDAMTLAGALTGLDLDWIDGVAGDQIDDKAFPEDSSGKNISKGNRGSWRAHMNALRRCVNVVQSSYCT